MARVALKLLLLVGLLSLATAQYEEDFDYYDPTLSTTGSESGSGSGSDGDPTQTDNEGSDDFDYQLPYDPLGVDICTSYPAGGSQSSSPPICI